MNPYFRILSIIVFLFVATSCVKTDDNNPDNPIFGEDQILWTFSLTESIGDQEMKDIALPAFDEANNGYYLVSIDNTGSGSTNNQKDVWVIALDEAGNFIWKIKATDTPESFANKSFISYSDGKVIVFMTDKLLCVDAQSGNALWSNAIYRTYWVNSMSVANGKIFYIDGLDITEKIVGVNMSDGSEFCRLPINVPGEDIRGELTMVSGGKLFVLTNDINNNNQWLSQLLIYNITDLPGGQPLAYTTPSDYAPANSALVATSTGSALFFMKNVGTTSPSNKFLVSVNDQGIENWKTEVPYEVQDIFIDAAENIYCVGPYDFLKYSATGAKIFETEIPFATYFDEFEILESNVVYGVAGNPETGEEDNIFTVFDLPTCTEQLRYGEYYPYAPIEGSSAQAEEENNHRLGENASFATGKKVADRQGRLISVGNGTIYCVKNFTNKLMPNAWGKRFGDLANTNSR